MKLLVFKHGTKARREGMGVPRLQKGAGISGREGNVLFYKDRSEKAGRAL